jgi:hypothetical protein
MGRLIRELLRSSREREFWANALGLRRWIRCTVTDRTTFRASRNLTALLCVQTMRDCRWSPLKL